MPVICNSCTVKVPQETEVVTVIDASTGAPVDFTAYEAAAKAAGVKLTAALAYAREGAAHPRLPGFGVEIAMEVLEIDADKAFDGDEADAEAAGWAINEFGAVCPDCSGTVHDTAEGVRGLPLSLGEVLDPILMAERLEREAETAAPDEAFRLCQEAALLRFRAGTGAS